jgi:uncharacterized delta-60 repeat protein
MAPRGPATPCREPITTRPTETIMPTPGAAPCGSPATRRPTLSGLRTVVVASALLLSVVSTAGAQSEGSFDASWINGGRRTIYVGTPPSDDRPTSMQMLRDGSVVIAGQCTKNAATFPCLAKLLADGQRDLSFGGAGTGTVVFDVFPGFPQAVALALAVDVDGSYVVLGRSADDRPLIGRVAADGASLPAWRYLDFVEGQPINGLPGGVAIRSDRRIVVAGSTVAVLGAFANLAATQLHPDLARDSSFGAGGSIELPMTRLGNAASARASDIALLPEGGVVLAATLATPGAPSAIALVKLTGSGAPDPAFGGAGDGRAVELYCRGQYFRGAPRIAIDLQRRIAVAVSTDDPVSAASDFCVNRYTADGGQDPGFGPYVGQPAGPVTVAFDGVGVTSDDFATAILALEDGRLLVAGTAIYGTTWYFVSARLVAQPSLYFPLDQTYGNAGRSYGSYTASGERSYGATIALGAGLMITGPSFSDAPDAPPPLFGVARVRHQPALLADGFE